VISGPEHAVFADVGNLGTAVCLMPGTELAFAGDIACLTGLFGWPKTIKHQTAIWADMCWPRRPQCGSYTGSISTSMKDHRVIAMRRRPQGHAGESRTSLTVCTG
jgi:hypothetical protein